MESFLSDCRPATSSAESEAFVISNCYGMGDPLASIRRIEEQGGGRLPPSITVRNDQVPILGSGNRRKDFITLFPANNINKYYYSAILLIYLPTDSYEDP